MVDEVAMAQSVVFEGKHAGEISLDARGFYWLQINKQI